MQKAVTHEVTPKDFLTEREFFTILNECKICGGNRILITKLQKDGTIKSYYAGENNRKKILNTLDSLIIRKDIGRIRVSNVVNLKYLPLHYYNKGIKHPLLNCKISTFYKVAELGGDNYRREEFLSNN